MQEQSFNLDSSRKFDTANHKDIWLPAHQPSTRKNSRSPINILNCHVSQPALPDKSLEDNGSDRENYISSSYYVSATEKELSLLDKPQDLDDDDLVKTPTISSSSSSEVQVVGG